MSDLAYAFDEGAGATAAEASGGPALAGVPAWGAGLHGSAMQVSGGPGPDFSPFDVDTAFTIMMDLFIAGDGVGGLNMVLSGSTFGNVQIINGSGILEWYNGPYPTTSAIPSGQWVNLAFTGDGTSRRAYVNGALAGNGSIASAALSGTDPVRVGGYYGGGYSPNIRVDNLRTFDSALTQPEIAALAGTAVGGVVGPPPNQAPTANAGPNANAYVGQQVTLTGSGTDTDGTIASYAWSQTSGPAVVLAGAGATRTFTPTTSGTYVFALVVTDDDGAQSVPDSVSISILNVPEEPTSSGGTARPVAKIGSIERALMALFVRDLEVLEESDVRIGGEFPREVDDFYIRIDRVPGGRATTFEGDFVVDIEVFSYDYLRAEDIAEDIESLMLADGYHSIVTGGRRWTFDGVFQNIGIADFPWDADEDMNRLGATYAITVRRGAV